MKLAYLIFCTCLFGFSSSKAAITTDTDIFFLCESNKTLLRINRITNKEKLYQTPPDTSDFHVHGKLLVFYSNRTKQVTTFHLDTGNTASSFKLPEKTRLAIFYKGYIIADQFNHKILTMHDITNRSKAKQIDLVEKAFCFYMHSDSVYIITSTTKCIVVDLIKFKTKKVFSVPQNIFNIRIIGSNLYAISANEINIYALPYYKFIASKELSKIYLTIDLHKDAIYRFSKMTNELHKTNIATQEETVYPEITSEHELKECVGPYLFLYNRRHFCTTIYDTTTRKTITNIVNFSGLDLNVSDTHYYLGSKKINLRYFKSSDDAYKEAEQNIKTYLEFLETSDYKDVLSPAEIELCVKEAQPHVAFALILSLYQPKAFLESEEGAKVFKRIVTAFGDNLLSGENFTGKDFIH